MASLIFDDIYSCFLGKITDYDFLEIDESDVYELFHGYLMNVISQPYISRLFSSFDIDKEIQVIGYALKTPVEEFSDENFVIEVLATGMVVEWLKPQVRSKLNTMQMFGGKESKFYAQANHISELRGLLEDTQLELRKMIRDRGYINNDYVGKL